MRFQPKQVLPRNNSLIKAGDITNYLNWVTPRTQTTLNQNAKIASNVTNRLSPSPDRPTRRGDSAMRTIIPYKVSTILSSQINKILEIVFV